MAALPCVSPPPSGSACTNGRPPLQPTCGITQLYRRNDPRLRATLRCLRSLTPGHACTVHHAERAESIWFEGTRTAVCMPRARQAVGACQAGMACLAVCASMLACSAPHRCAAKPGAPPQSPKHFWAHAKLVPQAGLLLRASCPLQRASGRPVPLPLDCRSLRKNGNT